MKRQLRFDFEILDRGQVNVTIDIVEGTAKVDSHFLQDTTAWQTTRDASDIIYQWFKEIADEHDRERGSSSEVLEESTASQGTEDSG